MNEIVIKVQLDLSDALKDFMSSLMAGNPRPPEPQKPVAQKATDNASKTEGASPRVAPQMSGPTPVVPQMSEPTPVVPKTEEVSREKIRELVKAARIAEKSNPDYDGGVKKILAKYGASNVPEINEEHFVDIAAELTRYKENLPPF